MPQSTRFNKVQEALTEQLLGWISSSWYKKSLGLLSLLSGYYLAANLTSVYLNFTKLQSFGALGLLLLVELQVRLRTRFNTSQNSIFWLMSDNLRVGAVYAVVLEAFKLGS
ncbi:DUF565 domain-containing protein [Synechococcus sp. UW140]|uniref:DUF565 domain-containing protein n=1 Tax=Synechococcus sp. UW140 TaxID=368503 RepID=UPI003137C9A8